APALARQSDADLDAALSAGPTADAVAALDASARAAVVAALRADAFDALVDASAAGTPAPSQRPAREAFGEAPRLLDRLRAARDGDPAAAALATDAYMRFEPYEKRLGAIDSGLVRRVEEGFVRLRQAVRGTPASGEVAALVATLHHELEQAAVAL